MFAAWNGKKYSMKIKSWLMEICEIEKTSERDPLENFSNCYDFPE